MPLIVKASSSSSSLAKRISFPSVEVDFATFRDRVLRSLSLPASSRIYFKDDDGDSNLLESAEDLFEALSFFSEDGQISDASTSTGKSRTITIRVWVLVEYEGPALSDTTSVSGDGGEGSGYSQSSDFLSSDYTGFGSESSASSAAFYRQQQQHHSQSELPYYARSISLSSSTSASTSAGRAGWARLFPPQGELRPSLNSWRSSSSSGFGRRRGPGSATGSEATTRTGTAALTSSSASMSASEADTETDAQTDYSTAATSTRCSACATPLLQMRYVCTFCGPLVPEEQKEGAEDGSEDGTELGVASEADSVEGDPEAKEVDLRALRRALSLDGSSTAASEASEQESGALLPPPPDPAGTVLSREAKAKAKAKEKDLLEPSEEGSEISKEEVVQPPPLLNGDSALDTDEGDGYELCDGCIETEGVKHARRTASGPGEIRHAFVEVIRQRGEWREVDVEDDVACTMCGFGPLLSGRFSCISCVRFTLCLSCYRTVDDIHPVHAFLAIPDRPARAGLLLQQSLAPPSRAPGGRRLTASSAGSWESSAAQELRNVRHRGVMCAGCGREIVGPRYRCTVCEGFDLCSSCENFSPTITSPDGFHDPSHALLKMKLPLSDELVAHLAARSRQEGAHVSPVHMYGRGGGWMGMPGPPPPFWGARHPPPAHFYGHGPPPPRPQPQPQAMQLGVLTPTEIAQRELALKSLFHQVACCACGKRIQGVRWLCAMCGTAPTYDLCGDCEKISGRVHDPLHAYLRLARHAQNPLPPLAQLIPVIYDPSVPPPRSRLGLRSPPPTSRRNSAASSDRLLSLSSAGSNFSGDSADDEVLHRNVVCDSCLEPVAGPWLRCAHCPTSFDLCGSCLVRVPHDPSHVFLKLVRKVDLPLLRSLAGISTQTPRPLLSIQLYAS